VLHVLFEGATCHLVEEAVDEVLGLGIVVLEHPVLDSVGAVRSVPAHEGSVSLGRVKTKLEVFNHHRDHLFRLERRLYFPDAFEESVDVDINVVSCIPDQFHVFDNVFGHLYRFRGFGNKRVCVELI